MAYEHLDETARPRLRDISFEALDQLYTPSAAERKFVIDTYRRTSPQTLHKSYDEHSARHGGLA